MKFFALFSVLILSTVAVKAQSEADSPVTPNPEDEIIKFQEKGLAILEIRLFTASLPKDLMERAVNILENTQIQFDSCKTALATNHIIWQYKLCIIIQLKAANNLLSQLENEASDRTTTATVV